MIKKTQRINGLVAFILLMVCLMAFSGCCEDTNRTDSLDDNYTEKTSSNSEIANPMQELTDEEAINELSYGLMLPNDAQNVETYLISGTLLERRYELDGINYTMRVAKADSFMDISGLYYEWDSENEMLYPTAQSVAMSYSHDGEYVDVINWFDDELSVNYSVSAISDTQAVNVMSILEEMLPTGVDYYEPDGVQEEIQGTGEKLKFSTVDIDGNSVTDSILKDAKVIMINYWEPWCGPCVREMPDIEELYEEYKDQGLLVIGVFSTKDMDNEVRILLNKYNISYPIVYVDSNLEKYGEDYVPSTIFVDSNGNIISSEPIVGAMDYYSWEEVISEYLK